MSEYLEISEFFSTERGKWRYNHIIKNGERKTVCGEKVGADWELGGEIQRGTTHCQGCLNVLNPVRKKIVGV